MIDKAHLKLSDFMDLTITAVFTVVRHGLSLHMFIEVRKFIKYFSQIFLILSSRIYLDITYCLCYSEPQNL